MLPGLDIFFHSRGGLVLLCVFNTICRLKNRIYLFLDIFRAKLGPGFLFFFYFILFSKNLPAPPPTIKIKWSIPYEAGEYLCSRSPSQTKHAVWISGLVDIHLLDVPELGKLLNLMHGKYIVNRRNPTK